MDTKILIAAHKKYLMPKDSIYLPVQAGASLNEEIGYQKDDEGKNISQLNPNFCELTVLYWGWQNLNCDYMGLVHYRRHFKGNRKGNSSVDQILGAEEVEKLLSNYDIILPKKRNYIIETLYSHYGHTHYKKDLDMTYEVIRDLHEDYIPYFKKQMKRSKAHMFNMFIMRKELVDSYCEFLFSILFELEQRIDITSYDDFQARLFGRISELLLDVWIEKNGYSYTEVPLIYMEKVPWMKKGFAFVQAKLFNRKYRRSF